MFLGVYVCSYLCMHKHTRGIHRHTYVCVHILMPRNIDLGFLQFWLFFLVLIICLSFVECSFHKFRSRVSRNPLQKERQRVSEESLDYIRRFRDLSLICYDPLEEERPMDMCIVGMFKEYRPYLKNLQIPSFTRLVEFAKRTNISVRRPSKCLTSQTTDAFKQSWKWESKKREVAV